MSPPAPEDGLLFIDTQTGQQSYEAVRPRDRFYVGREQVNFYLGIRDRTISKKQLYFYCVIYDEDKLDEVPPMIYVQDLSLNGTELKRACTESSTFKPNTTIRLTKESGSVLLGDGDELYLTPAIIVRYVSVGYHSKGLLDPLQRNEANMFKHQYHVTQRKIGEGGFGHVYVALEPSTARQFACKVISLSQRSGRNRGHDSAISTATEKPSNASGVAQDLVSRKLSSLEREYETIRDLSHPNIIAIEQVFLTSHNLYIIQDLITGGDLMSYLELHEGCLDDTLTAVIIQQLLKAVDYLHEKGVVHRDIKPENVLVTSPRPGARVVLTDFGHSRNIVREQTAHKPENHKAYRMHSVVGTFDYNAPEVHKRNRLIPANQGYSNAVDMWSIGAITATLLTGEPPFNDRRNEKFEQDPFQVVMELAEHGDLSYLERNPMWRQIGARPKAFVRALLVLEEEKRMTAKQALQHPWFANHHHAAEFDAVYKRAIRDWKPRQPKTDLVVRLDTGSIPLSGNSPSHRVSKHTPGPVIERSQYFHRFDSATEHSLPRPPVPSWSHASHKRLHTTLPDIGKE